MSDATERWLPIPGYEGFYEVSDLGRVRSLDRTELVDARDRCTYTRRRRGRVLRVNPDKDGYHKVRLGRDGFQIERKVHALVLETFDRPCPEGMECRHLNDIKADNRLVNLAWGTQSENKQDELRNGRNRNLSKTHCLKGHPYDEKNTRVSVRGNGTSRACRACHAEWERARRQERRNAA
jgi:NUMOD4 motif/HNH endonuclease